MLQNVNNFLKNIDKNKKIAYTSSTKRYLGWS